MAAFLEEYACAERSWLVKNALHCIQRHANICLYENYVFKVLNIEKSYLLKT